MKEMDKTIEVMKAAMEKENKMKDQKKEAMEGQSEADVKKKAFDETTEDQTGTSGEINLEEDNTTEDMEAADTDMTDTEDTLKGDMTEEKQTKNSKSIFKNNKNKELAAKDEKIEELTDRLMRTMAEFDNFRKRSDKEKTQMYDFGVKSVIEKLLPIIDNFERGLGAITEKEKESAFAQGIELIYKQLLTAMDEIGVKQIEAVGKEFDPNFHNAVMHGEDDNLEENIISDEFQKGYIYRDIVVRHSMVKVVN